METSIGQGTFVRLIHDISRIGIASGETRPYGGRVLIGVRFPTGFQFIPSDQLEPFPQSAESPVSLLEQGRFSEPRRLRQVLTHIRLTGRLADLIYSMETTNTEFHAYQFKPVLKMLSNPSGGLLIADEVGLGKTIEAGLIWTELQARYDFRRLLVICPRTLCEKWRRELIQKFGIDAQVLGATQLLERIQDSDNFERGFAVICSIQSLRPPRGWDDDTGEDDGPRGKLARHLRDKADESLFDLVVIDEAHHLRNPETFTHSLGRLLREVASYALFLSATPIHLSNRDLFSLLHLLDQNTFPRPEAFEGLLTANQPLVRARDVALDPTSDIESIKSLIDVAISHPLLLENRQLDVIRAELTGSGNLSPSRRADIAARLEQANLLGHVVNRTRRRDVEEWRVTRIVGERIIPFADNGVEQAFYDTVTQSIAQYACKLAVSERFLMATPQRMMSSCMAAALAHWRNITGFADFEEDADDDAELEARLPRLDSKPVIDSLVRATRQFRVEELEAADTKYAELRQILKNHWSEGKDEKIILFSSFKPTLNYLKRRLAEDLIRSELLHGSISEDRDTVLLRFAEAKGSCILLASEIGSEGIDLQFARVVINYDLPWNPMRVEQRIGRVDRLGQEASTVSVLSLLHADTIDARIYERLYARLDLCKHALGDFEAVLGEEIRILTRDLLVGNLSAEEQAARISQTAQALQNLKIQAEKLEDQAAGLIAHGDFILRKVKAAHEMNRWVSGDDIHRYIRDYLTQFCTGSRIEPIQGQPDFYEISLDGRTRSDLADFIQRSRMTQNTRLARDSSPVRCQFTPALTRRMHNRIEYISQLHPLTRFVANQLQNSEAPKVAPAVAARIDHLDVPQPAPERGQYVIAIMRWSLGGTTEVEKLAYAAVRLNDQQYLDNDESEILAIAAATKGVLWPEAPLQVDRSTAARLCQNELFMNRLQKGFDEFLRAREAENEDRASLQLRTLDQHQQDTTTILRDILERHQQAGRGSLVRATQGRIDALKARCDQRRAEIERLRRLSPATEDIAVFLVSVD